MKDFRTNIKDFTIRFANESDVGTIYRLIRELAEYEKLVDQMTATEEILYKSLFVRHEAEVLIGEYNGEPVGYALFFHSFSTFKGHATMYLEDIYVKPEYRGLGFGKAFFNGIAQISEDRNCGRLDWVCLEWNRPSRDFYEKLGAKCMSDWIVYRLDGQALSDVAR